MFKRTVFIFAFLSFSALSFAQDSVPAPRVVPGVLSVQSSVPAGLWVNGQAFGNTPFSMEVPTGWTIYYLRAQGYWSEVFLSKIEPGTTTSHEVQLQKYESLSLNKKINISHIEDLRTLEGMYDSISKQEVSASSDSLCLAYFVEKYPLIIDPPAPLHEDSSEYRKYFKVYIDERQLSFDEFYYSNCSGATKQNLNAILLRVNELEKKQVNGYVPVIGAEFVPTATNGLVGNLTFYFRSPDGRAEVAWQGVWENDFLTGDDLVRALTASAPPALAFLTAQNKVTWIPVEGGYSRHFYKYHELNISWNGLLFPMKGEFVLPDYIIAQPEVAEWLGLLPQDTLPPPPPPPPPQDTIIKQQMALAMLAEIPGGKYKFKDKVIEIKSFAMNTREIDQSLYKSKCGEKDFGKFKNDSLPAHSVSWNEANSCCASLGGSLPTEAEWEYAARAGSPYEYIWASNEKANSYAVFDAQKPVAVAGKKPNGWGLYDMFGNVAEWVKDDGFWFGKYKYFKGGSWKSKEKDLKFETSEEEDARYWGTHIGFRCVYR